MPGLAAVKSSNSNLKLISPTIVMIGGTAGIGESIALTFARVSQTPKIYLVGRSQQSADRILDELKKINATGQYHFRPCDLSSLDNIQKFTTNLKDEITKLNYLVLSPGILSTAGRTETKDGIDIKMMLHFYSRMKIIKDLMPKLEAAKKENEEARVLSVLDGVNGNVSKLNWNDLGLKSHFSIANAANHCISMTDIMMKKFSLLYPTMSFTHALPGFVSTGLMNGLPWYLRYPVKVFTPFGTSPEDCAEYMTYGFTHPSRQVGAHYLDAKGDPVPKKPDYTEEQMDNVWKHTNEQIHA